MPNNIGKNEYKYLNTKYGLSEKNADRLYELKRILNKTRNISISYDELIIILKSVMNYDEINIWLVRKSLRGEEATLDEILTKYFKTNNYEDFLRIYDIDQNCNQNNIDDVRSAINDYDEKQVLRLMKKN